MLFWMILQPLLPLAGRREDTPCRPCCNLPYQSSFLFENNEPESQYPD